MLQTPSLMAIFHLLGFLWFHFIATSPMVSNTQWMQAQVRQLKKKEEDENDFCIIIFSHLRPTNCSLFPPSPRFPQKRAKKLEGETIYIRHSNLMLEVCIQLWKCPPCCLTVYHCMSSLSAWERSLHFCFLFRFDTRFSPSLQLPCFKLDPNGLACTIFLSNSNASSLLTFLLMLFHVIWYSHFLCAKYMIGTSAFLSVIGFGIQSLGWCNSLAFEMKVNVPEIIK